ncbi:MAG: ABC transporter ATP-binding protein [Pseudomonadota bacterium]
MSTVEFSNVCKSFGSTKAVDDASFFFAAGSLVSLLGPSGCGKTSTLRLIAGFERVDKGKVLIDGADVGALMPFQRNVGVVFQDYALFPHMSVAQNIEYGLRRRHGRLDHSARVREMLQLVQLEGFQERLPSQLSGGQQQRVALARALAPRPEVILLDEPLSALDLQLRQGLRIELKRILAALGITAIVVTHDQEEALGLGDVVVVMNKGRIEQIGNPADIYNRPKTRFVAGFVGRSSWLSGRALPAPGGLTAVCLEGGETFITHAVGLASGAQVDICLRPERFRVVEPGMETEEKPQLVLSGRLVETAFLGPEQHLAIVLGSGKVVHVSARVTARSHSLPVGGPIRVGIPPDEIIIIPS